MRKVNRYKERILQVVKDARQPIDPENVRVRAGISNWQTALKHLLALALEGKIEALKTTKSWIFFANIKPKSEQAEKKTRNEVFGGGHHLGPSEVQKENIKNEGSEEKCLK